MGLRGLWDGKTASDRLFSHLRLILAQKKLRSVPFSIHDIPMIFGTLGLRGPDTALEAETSKYCQAVWASFAKDPKNALKQQFG